MKNLRPLGNKVLAEIHSEEKKTEAGLFIPASASSESSTLQAIVLAHGPDATHVKTGDMIYCLKYSGTECAENLLILREDEILGIIER